MTGSLAGKAWPVVSRKGGSLSALVPPSEDAFDLLLVPRLVGDLVFQVHLEANVSERFRLADPLAGSVIRRTLAGLRSRCTMPCWWAWCMARASVSTKP